MTATARRPGSPLDLYQSNFQLILFIITICIVITVYPFRGIFPYSTNTATTTTTTTTTTASSIRVKKGSLSPSLATPPQQQPAKEEDKAKFIFFVGIEGSGHHFIASALKDSPCIQRATELGLQDRLKGLGMKLYKGRPGYLNMHCKPVPSAAVANARNVIVSELKGIAAKVGNESLTIPLNAAGVGLGEMASYPQDRDACRPTKYPNLDLIYDACNEANVQCEHIYLYRENAYSVIKSTTLRRHYNRFILEAIHEYITMLYVIYGELATYPTRTAGCFGLEANNVSKEERWGPIRDLFGWKGHEKEFDEFLATHYAAPPLTEAAVREKIAKFSSYMDSMIRINNRVIELCQQQLRNNRISLINTN